MTVIIRERKRNNTQEEQILHNTFAHHLLTDALIVLLANSPPVYVQGMMLCGMEYPFSQFRSPVLAMLSPSFLCTCSMSENRKLKSPWLRASTAQQQLKHQCDINRMLVLNPKIQHHCPSQKQDFMSHDLAKYFYILPSGRTCHTSAVLHYLSSPLSPSS